jgi:hypothetical protein
LFCSGADAQHAEEQLEDAEGDAYGKSLKGGGLEESGIDFI